MAHYSSVNDAGPRPAPLITLLCQLGGPHTTSVTAHLFTYVAIPTEPAFPDLWGKPVQAARFLSSILPQHNLLPMTLASV